MEGAVVGMGVSALGLPELEAGYWVQASFISMYATAACLVPPFLRYPAQPAPERTVKLLTVSAWVVLVGILLVSAAFWQPSMDGYTGPALWITLYPWEDAARNVPYAIPVAFAPVVVWFTVVQWRRGRSAGGPMRTVVRLLAATTSLMAWGLLARTALDRTTAWDLQNVANTGHVAFTALALLLLLAVAVGLTLRRAAFLDDLVAASGEPRAIEHVLRRHTADPTLQLLFLTSEGWSDAAGRATTDIPGPGRTRHPMMTEEDTPVVVVEVSANVDLDDPATHSLIDGAGYVLRTARLTVQQSAQAHELRESRRRIVDASVAQRRRMERDLHDGAQQHLLAAQAALSRAELVQDKDELAGAIREARDRLATTMDELRRLARGVHPAVLSQAGLAAALESLSSLSDRVSVQVHPTLAGRRFAPLTEATVWFVASEAVVNALKHTDAPVRVEAALDAGMVLCRVVDDGPGGAGFVPGGGLAGLRDRVRAAGGTLEVTSRAQSGTSVVVRLPLDAAAEGTP